MSRKDIQSPSRIHGGRTSAQAGFSLLEVALAALVLAFAITTSITVLRNALGALDSARNITIATQMMQTEIEKMRLQDWATINAYGAGPTPITPIDPSFTANNPTVATRFTLSRSAADFIAGEMRVITFTVTWTTPFGPTMSRSFVTYYGREGLYDYYYNQI